MMMMMMMMMGNWFQIFGFLTVCVVFAHHVNTQTTEITTLSSTDHRQQTTHPIIPLSTSNEHALQTTSPNHDSLNVTTATSIKDEIFAHTPEASGQSQHVANTSDQTVTQTLQHSLSATTVQRSVSQTTAAHSVSSVTVQNSVSPPTVQNSVSSVTVQNSALTAVQQHSVSPTRVQHSGSSTTAQSTLASEQTYLDRVFSTPSIVTSPLNTVTDSESSVNTQGIHFTITSSERSSRQDETTDGLTPHSSSVSADSSSASQNYHTESSQIKSLDIISSLQPSSQIIHTKKETLDYNSTSEPFQSLLVTDTLLSTREIQISNLVSTSVIDETSDGYRSLLFSSVTDLSETPPYSAVGDNSEVSSKIETRQISSSSSNEVFQQTRISSSVGHLSDTDQSLHSRTIQITSTVFQDHILITPSSSVFEPLFQTTHDVQSESSSFYQNSTMLINAAAAAAAAGRETHGSVSGSELQSVSGQLSTEEMSMQVSRQMSESVALETQQLYTSEVLSSSYSALTQVTPASPSVTVRDVLNTTLSEGEVLGSEVTEHPVTSSSVFLSLAVSSLTYTDIIPKSTSEFVNVTTEKHPTTTGSTVSIITTPILKIIRDVRFLFNFTGNCHLIQNNTLFFDQFVLELMTKLSKKLNIEKEQIKMDHFSCKPFNIYVTFYKVPYIQVKHIIMKLIFDHALNIEIFIQAEMMMYTLTGFQEVKHFHQPKDVINVPDGGLGKVNIIVIIVACCICGILLCIGGTVCIKECYRRKYAQSFDLMEVPHVNLKLEDFTLTRIPRPKPIYKEDNVTMQSYTDSYGQHIAVDRDDRSKSNNGVHVRMKENTDGIVIGIVSTSSDKNKMRTGKKAKWHNSSSSENIAAGNPSLENLLPSSTDSQSTDGTHNPVYVDDESPSCSNDSFSKSS